MADHGPPEPIDEVQDHYGRWHLFHDFFGLGEVSLPLVNYGDVGLDRVLNSLGLNIAPDRPLITKFMILELLAAVLICAIYIPLAKKARDGTLPKGIWWNFWEEILSFVRNEIAKPNLHKDADKYTPYLWTVFLFLFVVNLLGMIPFMGSATASIWVTGAMAVLSLIMIIGAGIIKLGFPHWAKSQWPHIELGHPIMNFFIELPLFVLEFTGIFIKAFILAVRLFANMLAGHLVLATFLSFTYAATFTLMWLIVTPASVAAVIALSLLELFVAALQAYIFTFLTALFMGMQMHPEH